MEIRFFAASLSLLALVSCQHEDPLSTAGAQNETAEETGPIGDHPLANLTSIRNALPGNSLELTSEEIQRGWYAKLQTADSYVATDSVNQDGNTIYEATCSGDTCKFVRRNVQITYRPSEHLDEYRYEFDPVFTLNGIDIGQGLQSFGSDYRNFDAYRIALGGWTEHSLFYVDGGYYVFRHIDLDITGALAHSVGSATGSVPSSGSATWKGAAVAANLPTRELHVGEATLTADFGAANIDAAFTNFHETRTGNARPDINFTSVPFTEDGFKKSTGSKNSINGKFMGPDHVEASGVFRYENSVGAFGAKRD